VNRGPAHNGPTVDHFLPALIGTWQEILESCDDGENLARRETSFVFFGFGITRGEGLNSVQQTRMRLPIQFHMPD
jgi:hypothetical protein